jgi:hypothetical protein
MTVGAVEEGQTLAVLVELLVTPFGSKQRAQCVGVQVVRLEQRRGAEQARVAGSSCRPGSGLVRARLGQGQCDPGAVSVRC